MVVCQPAAAAVGPQLYTEAGWGGHRGRVALVLRVVACACVYLLALCLRVLMWMTLRLLDCLFCKFDHAAQVPSAHPMHPL
jgi:hypothetical protein